jgi:Flp pilus assembly protein TadD
MAAKTKTKSRNRPAAPAPRRAAAASSRAAHAPGTRLTPLVLLKIIVILASAAWVFAPVLNNTWYGDDTLYITGNPLLHEPGRLWKAWFVPGSFVDYYPLEQTVQWLQWKCFGEQSPYWYLVCNIVLHATSALLLWRLFARLGLRYAWLGGLLFAIYPLMVDSVGTATELKNTLPMPFLLLGLAAWIDFEQTRRPRDYALALGFYAVSMLCKITAYFIPVVLLLYAWWKRGKITRADWLAAAPFFVVSATLCLLHVHAGAVNAAETHYVSPAPIHLGGIGERLELAGQCLAFYFGHAFLPVKPLEFFPQWPLDPLGPLDFVPWLGIALVLAVCWIRRDSWGRGVFFALAFFTLGMAPFLGLNEVTYMCLGWVWDHLLYLPVIALMGVAVAGIEGLVAQLPASLRPAGIGLVALVFVLLGVETHAQSTLFADQDALLRDNLRSTPNSWLLHLGLGRRLAGEGHLSEAIAEVRESLRINPVFDSSEQALGEFLSQAGDFKGAIAAFQRALAINPDNHGVLLSLGYVLVRDGQLDAGVARFRAYVQDFPQVPEGHFYLGNALALQGHIPEAMAELQAALKLDPANKQIADQIAVLQARL